MRFLFILLIIAVAPLPGHGQSADRGPVTEEGRTEEDRERSREPARFDPAEEARKGADQNLSAEQKREIMTAASESRRPRTARQAAALRLYDRENTGRLDKYDLRDMARDNIMRWDLNGDGRLDQYELRNMRRELKAERLKREADAERLKRILEGAGDAWGELEEAVDDGAGESGGAGGEEPSPAGAEGED